MLHRAGPESRAFARTPGPRLPPELPRTADRSRAKARPPVSMRAALDQSLIPPDRPAAGVRPTGHPGQFVTAFRLVARRRLQAIPRVRHKPPYGLGDRDVSDST